MPNLVATRVQSIQYDPVVGADSYDIDGQDFAGGYSNVVNVPTPEARLDVLYPDPTVAGAVGSTVRIRARTRGAGGIGDWSALQGVDIVALPAPENPVIV